MPRYPYACRACDHRFDAFQKMSEDKLVECPQCKQPKLERLILGGTKPIVVGGVHGEKGLEYKERSRAEIAMSHPEKFDQILAKDRRSGNIGKDPLRPPS